MTTLADHDPPITGAMIVADRKRRKMSRTKYRELTGLTEARQANLESGKKEKPGDYEALYPYIFDNVLGPVTVESPPAAGAEAAPAAATPPAAPPDVPAPPPVADEAQVAAPVPAPITDAVPPAPVAPETPAPPDVELPIELVSGEELDDPELLGEQVVTPGSGLPPKVEYAKPGYHITNSELQTFKRCKRAWYLGYYRELKLIVPDLVGARAIGSRLHLALAAFYSSRREDPMTVLEATIKEDRALLEARGDVQGLDDLEKDADLARIMLEGYLEWVQEEGKDQGIEVIGDEVVVEELFGTAEQFDWDRDVILMGKLDLRVRRLIDGARLFMDHKSVGSLKEPLKTLHMNEQMLHYHLLEYLELLRAAQRGEAVEYARGGLYNMLRKVKRTARANPPFFDRVEVPHNQYELQSYWMRVWGEVTEIIALRKKLDAGMDHRQVAYPTPTGNCSWDCDFFTVCNLFDDGSDAERMLSDLYTKGEVHDYYLPYGESAVARQEGSQ
jgi:hypothetical protein